MTTKIGKRGVKKGSKNGQKWSFFGPFYRRKEPKNGKFLSFFVTFFDQKITKMSFLTKPVFKNVIFLKNTKSLTEQ